MGSNSCRDAVSTAVTRGKFCLRDGGKSEAAYLVYAKKKLNQSQLIPVEIWSFPRCEVEWVGSEDPVPVERDFQGSRRQKIIVT